MNPTNPAPIEAGRQYEVGAMTRRNLGTTAILAVAGVLLVGGMTFAREAERGDDRDARPTATDAMTTDDGSASASVAASPSADDRGGEPATSDGSPGPTASPGATFDDHGGDRAGSDDSMPTATAAPTADDHGGDDSRAGSDDSPSPTASADDHGGDDDSGSDDHGGDDDSGSDDASPSPTAAEDDSADDK
jgi:hypothetical protein